MKRLVVLISNIGTGSNLQSIINATNTKELNLRIVAVICDTDQAIGLKHARRNNIPIEICADKTKLLSILKKLEPDYIALAGWKQIISDNVIEHYPNKILNVHPGLIPRSINGIVQSPDKTNALWNRGLLGSKAIQNFLDQKSTYAGSSIHFLTKEFDFGPVLERAFEKIKKTDSVEPLYRRLKKKEHTIYVKALKNLTNKPDIKVLIIDRGGRGSALAEKYLESKIVSRVLAIPGNDYMKYKQNVTTFPYLKTTDIKQIVKIAKQECVDLVDVAQDDAIAMGLVDELIKNKIKTFGPTKRAGQIEWDKSWSRNFMIKNKLPAPLFRSFSSQNAGLSFINKQPDNKWYVKASGLAAGKGAIFAKDNDEAITAIGEMDKFGEAGKRYLIEECLEGEEFSAFAAVCGKKFRIIGYAQDHKRAFDGDLGPNTGGMGCSSPPKIITKKIENQILEIFKKTTLGLVKVKRSYVGILYLGGIIDIDSKVKIIEFNARWGDPEAQVILPAIQNDIYSLVKQTLTGQVPLIKKDKKYRVAITVSTKGYPGAYSKNTAKKIHGFESLTRKVKVYGAGIKKSNRDWITAGGRLFYVLGEGKNIDQARKMAYNALSETNASLRCVHYRTDIGYRDLNRLINATRTRKNLSHGR